MGAPFPVTARQLDALRFIAGYVEANGGISPTWAEMQSGLGFSSGSSVTRVVNALVERGCLRRLKGKQQAIEVLAPVSIPRAPATPDQPTGAPLYAVPGFGPAAGNSSICERTNP